MVLNDGGVFYFSAAEVEEVRVTSVHGVDATFYGYDDRGNTVFVVRNPKLVEVS